MVLEPYNKGKKIFHDLLIDSSVSTVNADYLGYSIATSSPFYGCCLHSYLYIWTTHAQGTVAGSPPCEALEALRMAAPISYSCFCGCCRVYCRHWSQFGLSSLGTVSCAGPGNAQSHTGGSSPGLPSWQVPGQLSISETALDPGCLPAFPQQCIQHPDSSRKKSGWAEFAVFSNVSVKSSIPVPHCSTWTGSGAVSQMFSWLVLWFLGTFIICSQSSPSQMPKQPWLFKLLNSCASYTLNCNENGVHHYAKETPTLLGASLVAQPSH